MSVRRLRPDEVAGDIRKQQRYLTGAAALRMYHRKVVGPVMVTNVIESFLSGRGPNDKPWKSGAQETKFAGRYSKRYNVRPSGRLVTPGSLRNLDTGALANGHTIISATASGVKVGPETRGKGGKARVIMEREAGYGNYAVGWDARRRRILDAEMQAYINEIAAGRTPRFMPRSRVRTRT